MKGIGYRLALLVLMSFFSSLLLVDYVRLPVRDYTEGQVADRDIRAPSSFHYVDWQRTEDRQESAARGVRIVFDHCI